MKFQKNVVRKKECPNVVTCEFNIDLLSNCCPSYKGILESSKQITW